MNRLPEIIQYFENLPEGQIYQSLGSYAACGCCVGAHLANFFGVATGTYSDYYKGRGQFARDIEVGEIEVRILLHEAGAPFLPFGLDEWKVPPATVFKKLQKNLQKKKEKG